MQKECNGLDNLLKQNKEANSYYGELPAYVKDMIYSRGGNICSFDDLKSYADNLLSGDK